MSDGYLTRFFINRRTGQQQRHMMLDDCSWALGEWIGPENSLAARMEAIGSGNFMGDITRNLGEARFFDERFDDDRACVSAFEGLGEKALADGCELVDIVGRTIDDIPKDAALKPAWHQEIDSCFLRFLAGDADRCVPKAVESKVEPITLFLQAQATWQRDKSNAAAALPFAQAGRAEIDRRRAAKAPFYSWSSNPHAFEARVYDLLFELHHDLGEKDAMFAAIRKAYDIARDRFRSENLTWAQCYHFPQYREDAFETAYTYAEFGYEAVKKHPDFAAFAARREVEERARGPRLRWAQMHEPSSATAITAAEKELGVMLPEDYRAFLIAKGRSLLDLEWPPCGDNVAQRKELKFCAVCDLPAWAATFQHWINIMGEAREGLTDEWPAQHGVSFKFLLSVATPWDNSACLLINLAAGDHYGHCFFWDHDEAYDLVPIATSFGEAVETIEKGFMSRDARVLAFFGIFLDNTLQ